MFARTTAFLNLANSAAAAANRRYYKHVACFTTLSDKFKSGSTPGKLSERDPAVEGNEGGYGGSGISDIGINTGGRKSSERDPAVEGDEAGYGGSGGIYEGGWSGGDSNKQGGGNRGGRRREEVDVDAAARDTAEMAKAGVVGAMEVGLKLGEMAKQTVDVMWDATRRTAETVRDSVADDSRNRGFDDRHDDDRTRRTPAEKRVDDLRRRAGGGYDFKGH